MNFASMPRFSRFVVVTSLLLLAVYLFYPKQYEADWELPQTSRPPARNVSPKIPPRPESKAYLVAQELQFPVGSLRERLSQLFVYDLDTSFPAFIWQTWKTTPSDTYFGFRKEEASWTEHHPGYIHEVITDEVAALLIEHLYEQVPDVLEAYNALPKPVLKSDFFRYLILLARGGIYSDIDTQALQPAWRWVPDELVMAQYGLIVGIEADPDREDWAQWYSRRVQLCQWTIRSKPGHPALIETVARLTEKTLELKKAGKLEKEAEKGIIEWTGPALFTDAVFSYFNSGLGRALRDNTPFPPTSDVTWHNLTGITDARLLADVVVLPITGFSPGQGHMGSLAFDDSHAMVRHEFEGSWKPEKERMKQD